MAAFTCMNSTSMQSMHSSAVAGRKAFSGTSIPSMSRTLPARHQARTVTPQALFTKNKTKNEGKSRNDKSAKEVEPTAPAFTRRREAQVGRLAMFGFAASLIGEITTGKGVLGQLSLETGFPTGQIELALVALIGYNLFSAARPGSPTFSESNQKDVKKRQKGPNQNPKITAAEPKKFLGITEFGFTKKNEIFVGRTAQLGFLASVIGEKVTGKGPLAQFGQETGIPLGQASIGLLAFITFFLVAAAFEGNWGQDSDQSQY